MSKTFHIFGLALGSLLHLTQLKAEQLITIYASGAEGIVATNSAGVELARMPAIGIYGVGGPDSHGRFVFLQEVDLRKRYLDRGVGTQLKVASITKSGFSQVRSLGSFVTCEMWCNIALSSGGTAAFVVNPTCISNSDGRKIAVGDLTLGSVDSGNFTVRTNNVLCNGLSWSQDGTTLFYVKLYQRDQLPAYITSKALPAQATQDWMPVVTAIDYNSGQERGILPGLHPVAVKDETVLYMDYIASIHEPGQLMEYSLATKESKPYQLPLNGVKPLTSSNGYIISIGPTPPVAPVKYTENNSNFVGPKELQSVYSCSATSCTIVLPYFDKRAPISAGVIKEFE